MKIFLSWSGVRSKAVAEALKAWIPLLIQSVDPWISVDIDKGRRWDAEISGQLEESKVGIICLTRDNLEASWLLFEAGAISKTKDAHVCTLLLDIKAADVQPPLGLFQHTSLNKDYFYKLLLTINAAVERHGERAPAESTLQNLFDKLWPDLEEQLQKIASQAKPARTPIRPEREILQEILDVVRRQERKLTSDTSPVGLLDEGEAIDYKDMNVSNLSELRTHWSSILKHVRTKISIPAASYLASATPAGLSKDYLTLAFTKEFHHAKALDAMGRMPFEDVINQCLDSPRRLRMILSSPSPPRTTDE